MQPQESPPAGHPALASVFRPRDYGHLLYSVCKEQSEKEGLENGSESRQSTWVTVLMKREEVEPMAAVLKIIDLH